MKYFFQLPAEFFKLVSEGCIDWFRVLDVFSFKKLDFGLQPFITPFVIQGGEFLGPWRSFSLSRETHYTYLKNI